MSDQESPSGADDGQPVSARIRARLTASRKRFFANDNISAFLEPGELEGLLEDRKSVV